MLTIHQASEPQIKAKETAGRPIKIGLAIAGGGPLGAIYELGALRALDEILIGTRLNRLEVYVGISAGSFLAASLANGISTAEMCRIFMGTDDAEFRFDPEAFLKPAYKEYRSRALMLPGIVFEKLADVIRHPMKASLSRSLNALSHALPTGIFSNESIHKFLEAAFAIPGRTNDFRKLNKKLYILAVDLDNGNAVGFGRKGHDHVPISKAVQASAALPGLYPPVEIDGGHFVDGALRRTLHGSAALDEGVDVLIGINPLVPYDTAQPEDAPIPEVNRLSEGGLPMVLSQTFRALIQSRIKVGFEKYRRHYPQASLVLIEPNRGDQKIFFTNIFSYSSRARLCEHAYQRTREDLRANVESLKTTLEPYGITINQDLLDDPKRLLKDSMAAEPRRYAASAGQLSRTLDDLDDWLTQQ